MKYLDCHTHVQFSAYEKDWKEVIQKAIAAQVWMVNSGTDRDTSLRAIEMANEFPEGVYATIGLHPSHTSESHNDKQEVNSPGATVPPEIFDYDFYKKMADDRKVVGIGECGLDYFRTTDEEAKNRQKEAFLAQLELAGDLRKPVIIHCRAAYEDMLNLLRNKKLHPNLPGIIHFFSGTIQDAKELMNQGFYFTFGGVLTFTRDYDEVVRYIPMDRILSETDAPYVTPAPNRGKRNEPINVIDVVNKIAEIKGLGVEDVAERLFENGRTIYQLS